MSIFKRCLSLVPAISVVIATTATAKPEENQCVDVYIPEFSLVPDSDCSIRSSKLVLSKAPDQKFLNDPDIGFPAELSCFLIFNYSTWQPIVDGAITNPETDDQLPIKASGMAGLTVNAYPYAGIDPGVGPGGAQSFTAASLLSIMTSDGKELGPLVTRDAGTIFTDGSAAARLSVIKGQGVFSGATGYIDEVGQEFDPTSPAMASGKLCGKGLADSLFPES